MICTNFACKETWKRIKLINFSRRIDFFSSIANSIEKSNEIACKVTDSKHNRIRPIKPITIAKNDAYSTLQNVYKNGIVRKQFH